MLSIVILDGNQFRISRQLFTESGYDFSDLVFL